MEAAEVQIDYRRPEIGAVDNDTLPEIRVEAFHVKR
jgi:hypothetical protein